MTSSKLSKELAAIGRDITPAGVRAAWAIGAPRSTAKAFLKWREAKAKKREAAPELKALREKKITKEIALLEEKTIAEKRENQLRAGELCKISEVHEHADRCLAKARAVLTQKFETELPPKQDGMPAEKIAELNRIGLDQVFKILSEIRTYQ